MLSSCHGKNATQAGLCHAQRILSGHAASTRSSPATISRACRAQPVQTAALPDSSRAASSSSAWRPPLHRTFASSTKHSSAIKASQQTNQDLPVAASDAQQPDDTRQQPPPATQKYSPLHVNIENFCRQIEPTTEEKRVKHDVIEGWVSTFSVGYLHGHGDGMVWLQNRWLDQDTI
jgi:hypothetical protein